MEERIRAFASSSAPWVPVKRRKNIVKALCARKFGLLPEELKRAKKWW